jgi:endonuclease/exonuclease/phosphatase family metal-dependent hydrolase
MQLKYQRYTIGFYNLENLFDTHNDPQVLDDDFTPRGRKNWTEKRYARKLKKLAKAIGQIGDDKGYGIPVLLGLAEVENKRVLKDLLHTGGLRNQDLGYVHFESPDERGIDTALLYHKKFFNIKQTEVLPLLIYEEDGERDYTRDILYVKGLLNGEPIHVFVNHWPSRREGDDETAPKRLEAAKTLKRKLEALGQTEANPNLVIMGDFNAGPYADSVNALMEYPALYNPMKKLLMPHRGSANYKGEWSLFDQIIISHSFFDHVPGTHSFAHANIFDERFLTEWKGRAKGRPFRTYRGRKYLGGYSDHFPVYISLKWNP